MGIRHHLGIIFNSWISELSIFFTLCCMIFVSWQLKIYCIWTNIAIASVIIEVMILTAWLAWAAFKIFTKSRIKLMPNRSRIILEGCSAVLMLIWAWLTGGIWVALIWLPFMIWNFTRGIKTLNHA